MVRLIHEDDEKDGPAFVLEEHDRFHSILVSEPVRFDSAPGFETLLTFFVIRRELGWFDIINVLKTFQGKKCISKKVQTKEGIPAARIADEVAAVRTTFSQSIEQATGCRLNWHTLDLSTVETRAQQVERIRAWGRVTVRNPDAT